MDGAKFAVLSLSCPAQLFCCVCRLFLSFVGTVCRTSITQQSQYSPPEKAQDYLLALCLFASSFSYSNYSNKVRGLFSTPQHHDRSHVIGGIVNNCQFYRNLRFFSCRFAFHFPCLVNGIAVNMAVNTAVGVIFALIGDMIGNLPVDITFNISVA